MAGLSGRGLLASGAPGSTNLVGAVAQSGSAPRSHRGGQGFESPQLHMTVTQQVGQQGGEGAGRRIIAMAACASLAAGGLWAAGLASASPAGAVRPIVGCGWIQDGEDNRDNTLTCTQPGRSYTIVVEKDCWKYAPPENTVVLERVGNKWRKTDNATLLVRKGAAYCDEDYPYMTRVTMSTEGLKPYETRRFRLVQPEGERARSTLAMFVCLMRDGRNKDCP